MPLSRWSTVSLAMLGTAAGGSVTLGSPVLAAPFMVLFAAMVVVSRLGRRVTRDDRWDVVDGAGQRAAAGRSPSTPAVVGRALGRFEARALLASAWIGAGLGICVLAMVAVDLESSLNEASSQVIFLAHPLVGMAIIAAHRASTRADRDDTVELFAACPSHRSRRAVGVVWAAVVPAAALCTFAISYLAVVGRWGTGGAWIHPAASGADVATTCMLGVGGVALGAAMGRWIRFPLTPVIAIVVIGFISLNLGASSEPEFESRMVFSTFGAVADGLGGLDVGQAVAHLAWITTLTLATVVVAIKTDRGLLNPANRRP